MRGVRSSSPQGRRTWPQRSLLAFNVFLISTALLSAVGLGIFYTKYSQIARVDLAGVLNSTGSVPGGPTGALNFLLVGSDSRDNVDPDSPDFGIIQDGSVSGQRADTIMILRIDPRSERAAMISLPRDLWIDNPATGRKSKINSAFEGGPEQLIRAIQTNFNIPINHYIEVDFVGFKALVEAIDGVPIYFPAPTRDRGSGLNIEEAGCRTLDGVQALAFVRARNYEELVDGRWRFDPTADLGRISRQQVFIGRVIRRAISQGVRDITKLNALINVGIQNVTLDDSLSARDLIGLGSEFRTANPDDIARYRLPVTDGTVSGLSVLVVLDQPAQPVLDIFRGLKTIDGQDLPEPGSDNTDSRAVVLPSEVQIRVLNGSGAAGQASQVAGAMQSQGFGISAINNADRADYATSVVQHTAETQAEALFLTRWLVEGAVLQQVEAINGADVSLIIGTGFSGVFDTPRGEALVLDAPAATTTTSVAPSPTSVADAVPESTTATTVIGVVPDQTAAETPCG